MDAEDVSPEVEEFLMLMAGTLLLTYDKMAGLVARRFGKQSALAPGDIATFLGRKLRGASSLNQLQRDREVAAWLRENTKLGSLRQIRAACIDRFGIDRVPSQTTTSAFLRAAGRRGRRGDATFLGDKPEVVAWLREKTNWTSLAELRSECIARFGKERTPSRSSLQRFLLAENNAGRSHRQGIWADKEVGNWLRQNVPYLKLADLHARCVERFGVERARSRSAMYRFLAAQKGAKLTRKKRRRELTAGLAALSDYADAEQTLPRGQPALRAGGSVPD